MRFIENGEDCKLYLRGRGIELKGSLPEIATILGLKDKVQEGEDELGRFLYWIVEFEKGKYAVFHQYQIYPSDISYAHITAVLYEGGSVTPSEIVGFIKQYMPQIEFVYIPPDERNTSPNVVVL